MGLSQLAAVLNQKGHTGNALGMFFFSPTGSNNLAELFAWSGSLTVPLSRITKQAWRFPGYWRTHAVEGRTGSPAHHCPTQASLFEVGIVQSAFASVWVWWTDRTVAIGKRQGAIRVSLHLSSVYRIGCRSSVQVWDAPWFSTNVDSTEMQNPVCGFIAIPRSLHVLSWERPLHRFHADSKEECTGLRARDLHKVNGKSTLWKTAWISKYFWPKLIFLFCFPRTFWSTLRLQIFTSKPWVLPMPIQPSGPWGSQKGLGGSIWCAQKVTPWYLRFLCLYLIH